MDSPDDLTNEIADIAASDLAGLVASTVGGALLGFALAVVTIVIVRLRARTSPMLMQVHRRTRIPMVVDYTVVGAFVGFALAAPDDPPAWYLDVRHILLILLIAATGWLAYTAVGLLRDASVLTDLKSGRDARRFRTQAQVLRRVLQVAIVTLTLILILLTFPAARAPMVSLLASAGVLSVVVGMAAQSTLGNMLAGVQLAFTDALRVGDTVRLEENEDPGTIEEITLNYVVVRSWDERRLLVPSSTFTSQTFENWTRRASKQLGYFELQLDWTAPMGEIRAEVERLVFATPLWDKRNWTVQVAELEGPYMTVRVIVSADNWGKLIDLRSYLRENLVAWIRANAPWSIPRERLILDKEDERAQGWPTEEIRQDQLADPAFTGPLGGGFMRTEQQMKILENQGVDVDDPDAITQAAKDVAQTTGTGPSHPMVSPARSRSLSKLVKSAVSSDDAALSHEDVDEMLQQIPGGEDPYDHPVPKHFKELGPGHMLFSGTKDNEKRAKMYDGPGQQVLADREARGEMRRQAEQEPLPPEVEATRATAFPKYQKEAEEQGSSDIPEESGGGTGGQRRDG